MKLGILSTFHTRNNPTYGKSGGLFKAIIRHAQKMGATCFVFGTKDIDWKKKKILGNKFKEESWHSSWYGFPNVIYDRSFEIIGSTETREKLSDECLFINSPDLIKLLIDKHEIYKILNKGHIRQAETQLYSSRALDYFLKNFRHIYLKPQMGKRGEGQISLRVRKRHFFLQFSDHENIKIIKSRKRLTQLIENHIKTYVEERDEHFIIQEGIKISKFQNSVYDIRALMQKDLGGKWKLTGMAARVSGKGKITSNIAKGGYVHSITKLLRKKFNKKVANCLLDQVRKNCHQAAKLIEKKVKSAGEIAFDILVDKTGQIFILELNSKPGKFVFRQMGKNLKTGERFRDTAVRRPIEYALYLAKNRQKNG